MNSKSICCFITEAWHLTRYCVSGFLATVVQDGQNPVVIKSGSVKRKLLPNTRASVASGDIIEFLPGKLPYKLVFEPTQDELVLHSSLDVQNVRSTQIDVCRLSHSRSSELLLQEHGSSVATKKREWEAILIDSDEDEQVTEKQKQQLLDDEALARALQVTKLQ